MAESCWGCFFTSKYRVFRPSQRLRVWPRNVSCAQEIPWLSVLYIVSNHFIDNSYCHYINKICFIFYLIYSIHATISERLWRWRQTHSTAVRGIWLDRMIRANLQRCPDYFIIQDLMNIDGGSFYKLVRRAVSFGLYASVPAFDLILWLLQPWLLLFKQNKVFYCTFVVELLCWGFLYSSCISICLSN